MHVLWIGQEGDGILFALFNLGECVDGCILVSLNASSNELSDLFCGKFHNQLNFGKYTKNLRYTLITEVIFTDFFG